MNNFSVFLYFFVALKIEIGYNLVMKSTRRGRPKKQIKYTKTINVRFTPDQWLQVLLKAQREHLEPSVHIRKTVLESLKQ